MSPSTDQILNQHCNKQVNWRKSGQVVAEYVMILSFVVAALATTKIKITATGQLDLSGSQQGSVTIMEKLSESFTIWMRDILIIISFPS